MSFVDSLKKGLFGSEDDYDDQYMDDGPQMVNNNSGLGVAGNEGEDEPEEGAAPKRNGKVVNIHATTQLKVVLVKPEHFEETTVPGARAQPSRQPSASVSAALWVRCSMSIASYPEIDLL